jgi:hypothetical protein
LTGVAFISELATMTDTPSGLGNFNSAVAETVTISDEVDRRLLWEIINTYQATNWQNIKTVN